MPNLTTDHIDMLRHAVRGKVLLPADAGYETARTVWNATVDRRPAIIVQCSGTADVMQAVGFARDRGLVLAVRGGGHNIAGSAICNGGLVIDLSQLRTVHVDPLERVAWVSPGATLADFDHEAQAQGLATPLGINSTTGVAGLTLGGGFGWLTRKYGMTVDNLLGCEIVTADGTRHWTDSRHEPELFWALRGGGGNFGVVTLFQFRLHPVGPMITAGLLVFPAVEAKAVLRQYRAYVESTMPEDLNVWVVLRKAPPLPFLPASAHGKDVVVLAVFHDGDPAAAEKAIEPLRKFGETVGEHVGQMPYTAWQQAFDALLGPGARNYWKSHNFTRLEDGAIDAMTDFALRLPSPLADIFVGQVGGVANRVAPDATAYHHRDARYVLNVHARWERPDEDAACIAWARDFFRATETFATGGVYVNFLTDDETARIGAAYGPNYARLAQIKRTYDPQNLFSTNQNIAPAS
ncbi:FAD/FMN-containing dehydrogenase [Cupriavidus metallidurans]|jgi:FAD/FMN-containing dehydrogenase|uniref:FAD/FMN-containing oxidoreductase n=1 Tax=Cupriavidus metallidurans (strain ATCC 43123 / DSM 2839 / NBRC 102507 / CH34) TaxID=266264 RepID=Q1LHN5_CUPMC|nr:FAD-binding oxidoreductase [Cupriavidus metallidurans]ABF10341.1 FAD/FMN-containing oxidoreductase [Cupriavidus metallidurans CH34]KWW33722.1 6-hydroxy-D-nicotine oxidase [Cupriavidus metallidurans]MDE4919800.1 FAD-binding oxidoreductase [Cupriavidus metallidurans]QGS28889.1 FAD-binding protein [Cupriavidus metallidurans]UBM10875.1 FAD-binding oxidoreductase [Cupriavidus metallidurans]